MIGNIPSIFSGRTTCVLGESLTYPALDLRLRDKFNISPTVFRPQFFKLPASAGEIFIRASKNSLSVEKNSLYAERALFARIEHDARRRGYQSSARLMASLCSEVPIANILLISSIISQVHTIRNKYTQINRGKPLFFLQIRFSHEIDNTLSIFYDQFGIKMLSHPHSGWGFPPFSPLPWLAIKPGASGRVASVNTHPSRMPRRRGQGEPCQAENPIWYGKRGICRTKPHRNTERYGKAGVSRTERPRRSLPYSREPFSVQNRLRAHRIGRVRTGRREQGRREQGRVSAGTEGGGDTAVLPLVHCFVVL